MKKSHPESSIRLIEKESDVELVFSMLQIREEMEKYLLQKDIPSSLTGKGLKNIVRSFGDCLQLREPRPMTSSAIEEELEMYKRKESAAISKERQMNQEILRLMNNLMEKEAEISEMDNQVFELKLKIEQKERLILDLRLNSQRSEKGQTRAKVQNNSGTTQSITAKHRMSQVRLREMKILPSQTHSSIPIDSQSSRSQSSLQKMQESQWVEERKKLLKMLKEKDQRIYELIKELS